MRKKYLLLTILLAIPTLVSANDLQDEWQEKKEKNPWSGYVSADYSRNGYADGTAFANRSASGVAVVRYAVTDKSRLQLVVSGYHQEDGDSYGSQGQFWNDTSIAWGRNGLFKPTEDSSVSGEARLILPTSKSSQRTDLDLGVGFKFRWNVPLDNWIDGLEFSDTLLLRKNFHEYKTAGGHQLIEYRVSNQLSLDYSITDNLYFNIFMMTRQSWDYHGNTFDPNLLHGEEIGYLLTDNILLAVGMTNGVSYYNAEKGMNPINDLIDLNKTTYYTTVSYLF